MPVSRFFYNLGIQLYGFGIYFASFFSSKAKHFILGRKEQVVAAHTDKCYWFHCASLGEYEQARPLIQAIRSEEPNRRIVLTFFSPSGYEVRKDSSIAHEVYYLPLDTQKNANSFIEAINPGKVFFVKYEFWYHYLKGLKSKGVPTFLVSGIFRKKQIFFGKRPGVFGEMLSCFTQLFVQNENSKRLLNAIGIDKVQVTGDTRFDTVVNTKLNARSDSRVEAFIGDNPCLVWGSTWKSDEQFLSQAINSISEYKIIIAPHEVNENRLQEVEQMFGNVVRYSNLKEERSDKKILLIDNIGMLTNLYQYAEWSYIGGGFGVSIHNVLEAAVFGVPVVFGPNHNKMKEAIELVELKGAFTFRNQAELNAIVKYLLSAEERSKTGNIAGQYVNDSVGATESIMNYLKD